MTEKEMKKLSRADLQELLIAQMRENDRLEALLAEKEAQLQSREIAIQDAGSIAEAALKLNEVFSSAQAADQYLENIQMMQQRAEENCRKLVADEVYRTRDRKISRSVDFDDVSRTEGSENP